MKNKTIWIIAIALAMLATIGTVANAEQKGKEPFIKFNQSMVMQECDCEDLGSPYSPWRFTDREEYLLAHLMASEAGGEGDIGMQYVLMVVLNRVDSPDFPNTIEEVIFQEQRGRYQFSPLEDGRFWEVEPDEVCYEILADVQTEYFDATDGALYFCESSHNKWHKNKEYLFTYKHHSFYK